MTSQSSNEPKAENKVDDEHLADVAGGVQQPENKTVESGEIWLPKGNYNDALGKRGSQTVFS